MYFGQISAVELDALIAMIEAARKVVRVKSEDTTLLDDTIDQLYAEWERR